MKVRLKSEFRRKSQRVDAVGSRLMSARDLLFAKRREKTRETAGEICVSRYDVSDKSRGIIHFQPEPEARLQHLSVSLAMRQGFVNRRLSSNENRTPC